MQVKNPHQQVFPQGQIQANLNSQSEIPKKITFQEIDFPQKNSLRENDRKTGGKNNRNNNTNYQ